MSDSIWGIVLSLGSCDHAEIIRCRMAAMHRFVLNIDDAEVYIVSYLTIWIQRSAQTFTLMKIRRWENVNDGRCPVSFALLKSLFCLFFSSANSVRPTCYIMHAIGYFPLLVINSWLLLWATALEICYIFKHDSSYSHICVVLNSQMDTWQCSECPSKHILRSSKAEIIPR